MSVGLLKQVLDGRSARIRQRVVRCGEDAADQDEVAAHLVRVSQHDTTTVIKSAQGLSTMLSEEMGQFQRHASTTAASISSSKHIRLFGSNS
jgi:hypothetical protein